MNSLLSWDFSTIFSIYGSSLSVFSGLRAWICIECLVSNNTTTQILNEICNDCLYLFLDWMVIFCIVYDTWCVMSKRYLIDWYEPVSYIHFYSSAIIVPQLVDFNLVFRHNYSHLVQLLLCCSWYTTKDGLLNFLDLGSGWTHNF